MIHNPKFKDDLLFKLNQTEITKQKLRKIHYLNAENEEKINLKNARQHRISNKLPTSK